MNKECKHISIEINYKSFATNMEVVVVRKASVNFGVETTFAQINAFIRDAEKIIQSYKYCAKNAVFCKVYLSSAVYDQIGLGSLTTRTFDGWQFEEVPMDGDAEGLYLSPDLRYTRQERDIYIDFSKPLLSQLAEAHI